MTHLLDVQDLVVKFRLRSGDLTALNCINFTLIRTCLPKHCQKLPIRRCYMPNHMHRKLQKVLMHDSIYIDGDYWKRRDSYDTKPVKKYNLTMASALLTKYDSVEKNTM